MPAVSAAADIPALAVAATPVVSAGIPDRAQDLALTRTPDRARARPIALAVRVARLPVPALVSLICTTRPDSTTRCGRTACAQAIGSASATMAWACRFAPTALTTSVLAIAGFTTTASDGAAAAADTRGGDGDTTIHGSGIGGTTVLTMTMAKTRTYRPRCR